MFRADALVTKVPTVPKRVWQKLSAGRGAKGRRFYDWAVIDLADEHAHRPRRLSWSAWRRRHQVRSIAGHYRRQAAYEG